MPCPYKLLLAAATLLNAFYGLSRDQLKLLQDPGGWDYIKMTDTGIQTEHTCFDGNPHPETLQRALTFEHGQQIHTGGDDSRPDSAAPRNVYTRGRSIDALRRITDARRAVYH